MTASLLESSLHCSRLQSTQAYSSEKAHGLGAFYGLETMTSVAGSPNKPLQPTAIPLREMSAAELIRSPSKRPLLGPAHAR